MFFSAALTDIYEIEDKYHLTCMIDSDSGFKFNIKKNKVYGTPYIGAHISGYYNDNKQITNLFIE
ncbi:hypothetical protein BTXL6_11210 [Bacillus thuringiensis]|nr:hypothetical protein BTXL6_28775 [Bacillus thuringiensis]ALL21974.1 hypothetical protein BTXL6_11210 [Bacillus thuringiensis]EEM19418.1 hypothetical protein bthur0001_54590 [Bacillus thuringiensis serovar tochigiensis BGSC 4Y1]